MNNLLTKILLILLLPSAVIPFNVQANFFDTAKKKFQAIAVLKPGKGTVLIVTGTTVLGAGTVTAGLIKLGNLGMLGNVGESATVSAIAKGGMVGAAIGGTIVLAKVAKTKIQQYRGKNNS